MVGTPRWAEHFLLSSHTCGWRVRLPSIAQLVFLRLSRHYPLGHNEYTFIHTWRSQSQPTLSSLSQHLQNLEVNKARMRRWTTPSRVDGWRSLLSAIEAQPALKLGLPQNPGWVALLPAFCSQIYFNHSCEARPELLSLRNCFNLQELTLSPAPFLSLLFLLYWTCNRLY